MSELRRRAVGAGEDAIDGANGDIGGVRGQAQGLPVTETRSLLVQLFIRFFILGFILVVYLKYTTGAPTERYVFTTTKDQGFEKVDDFLDATEFSELQKCAQALLLEEFKSDRTMGKNALRRVSVDFNSRGTTQILNDEMLPCFSDIIEKLRIPQANAFRLEIVAQDPQEVVRELKPITLPWEEGDDETEHRKKTLAEIVKVLPAVEDPSLNTLRGVEPQTLWEWIGKRIKAVVSHKSDYLFLYVPPEMQGGTTSVYHRSTGLTRTSLPMNGIIPAPNALYSMRGDIHAAQMAYFRAGPGYSLMLLKFHQFVLTEEQLDRSKELSIKSDRQ